MAKKKPSKVIAIDYGRDLFHSKAWISLSGKATQVYALFLCKRQGTHIQGKKGRKKEWLCTNCHELEFTYPEAKARGITKRQFTRAIDQLVRHGFISVVETGGAYQKHKSKYALIDNWRDYGTDKFKPGKPRDIDPVNRGYRKPKRLKR
jgi:hypothetical protein